jgi:hypothetical protein
MDSPEKILVSSVKKSRRLYLYEWGDMLYYLPHLELMPPNPNPMGVKM